MVTAFEPDIDVVIKLTAMALLTSKGSLRSVPKMMQLMDENLTPDKRVEFWETLKNSFDGIPPYHPYGLAHRRDADITEINKWYNENKSSFEWDPEAGKFKVK